MAVAAAAIAGFQATKSANAPEQGQPRPGELPDAARVVSCQMSLMWHTRQQQHSEQSSSDFGKAPSGTAPGTRTRSERLWRGQRKSSVTQAPVCWRLLVLQKRMKCTALKCPWNVHAGNWEVDEYGRRSMPSLRYTQDGLVVQRLTTGNLMKVVFFPFCSTCFCYLEFAFDIGLRHLPPSSLMKVRR